ncbi:AMP-binding protein [Flavobacterium sp. GT3R68]|uniref:AMP-binding protein n=1 Tax=Flavobacterium sp. GT3R68 TaxID=2594437 RepID=UPI000F886FFA|nr:AMP-binding protein [Flavobacterium sp. GT3R68]RTY94905.1 O-succinylbenzoic acid--CoA ligase [Flavobacterium sp. GSN2]TRW91709.1 AMP-binding protein [Flavobacterium sp. GT3R68]
MNNPTYKNVHNRFKWNGLHLDALDLSQNAIDFIRDGNDYEKDLGEFILEWFDEKSFIEVTTSGTTGTPKQMQINKQAMVNSALATGDFFDITVGDTALHCLPVKYIAGKMMFVRGLILGLEMDFVPPSSTPLDNNIKEYDFAAMLPLQVQNSLPELENIKKVIIGGAKINETLRNELLKLDTLVYETYGMTETITHMAAKKIEDKAFLVLPDVKISQDERGCLVISASRISEEKIITNDLVELVSENHFLLLGRIDNVINSGGVKLIPEHIEEKLSGNILQRFFAIGIPDETLGEKLILVVEGEAETIDSTILEVLDKYEKPKEIRYVPKFKETASGKVMRKETLKLS